MDFFSINARVRAIRKAKGLSQAEFGKAISLKQGGVSYIEQEGNTVTEQNITLICQKFNVRRAWLVDGDGDMYDSPENSLFASFAKEFGLDQAEQNLARFVLTLPVEERRQLLKSLLQMADAIRGIPPRDIDIDKELSDYRLELEAQKAGLPGKFPPSATTAATEKQA